MRLTQHAWLLASLIPSAWTSSVPKMMDSTVGNVRRDADTANMKIWDIDSSCSHYPNGGTTGGTDKTTALQNAFTEALLMGQAAKSALTYVLGKRPSQIHAETAYNKWIRIADSAKATLGIEPDPDKVESADSGYYKDVFAVLNKVVTVLPGPHNIPKEGYNPNFHGTPAGTPMLVCGDDSWQWFGLKDIIPGPGNVVFEKFGGFAGWIKKGAKGAWYKKGRWVFMKTVKDKPILCDGIAAGTSFHYNMVVFCERSFADRVASATTLTKLKENDVEAGGELIREGTGLSDILEKQLSVTAFHEMMHWFGGVKGDNSDDINYEIDDQTLTTPDGELMYNVNGKIETSDVPVQKAGWVAELAYGSWGIWNIAKTFTGKRAANGGPTVATKNADSLAYFAAMMYLDDWTWAYEAEARKIGRIYGSA